MSADSIALDELVAEYERLGLTQGDDAGQSTQELMVVWKLSEEATRKLLKRGLAAGIVRAGKKRIRRMDGIDAIVPCYAFVMPKKGKKK